MAAHTRWTAPITALTAAALLLGAVTAGAQDTDTQVARADEVMKQALADGSNGQFADACEGARRAVVMYHNATMSLMSHPMQTDEDRQTVRAYADWIQEREDAAKKLVQLNCGHSNS